MTDDDLLAALGQAARDEERLDARDEELRRLTHGELTEAEIAALESEVGADAVAVHRPLGSDFKDEVAKQLEALLPAEPRATVTPLRPRWVVPAAVAMLVAAAAGMLLFGAPRGGGSALPGYELALSGGASEIRGTSAEPVRLTPGSRVTLLVRPSTSTNEPVSAFVFLRSGAELASIPAKSASSPAGAIKLEVSEADLPASAGPALTLVVVVGRSSVLDSADAARAFGVKGSGRDYQVLEAHAVRGK